jgi:hypothetical protein
MTTIPVTKMPNLYTLHNNVIQGGQFSLSVSYATSGIDGKPHLQYHDTHETLHFSGEEIRTIDSEVGTLVSVTIRRTVDSGSTSFTLVIPNVNLGQSTQTHISTFGITTIHRFSVVPIFNQGQVETYTETQLEGTAELVSF